MATRKHSLLAANRKNMGLLEDAYSQTQAFNDPVVQRRKMFGHMADTGKSIYSGWKSLQSAAQDYYTGELQKNPPKYPVIEGEFVPEDDDLADDLTIEETELDVVEPWDPPADNEEWLRSQQVGANPAKENIITGSGGSTDYHSTVNTEDLVFKPTEQTITNIVNVALNGIPTEEEIAANPRKYYGTPYDPIKKKWGWLNPANLFKPGGYRGNMINVPETYKGGGGGAG